MEVHLSLITEEPFFPGQILGDILKGHNNLSELMQMNLEQSV